MMRLVSIAPLDKNLPMPFLDACFVTPSLVFPWYDSMFPIRATKMPKIKAQL